MFTKESSIKNANIDVHHILKIQKARHLDVNPYIYLNQFEVEHYHHINKLHNNYSEEGKTAQKLLLDSIISQIETMISKKEINITPLEFEYVYITYEYCTVQMWDKLFLRDNYSLIMKGYKVLERESEKYD